MMKQNNKGFTLVELVMVIAILALIATLAISRLSGVKVDSEKKLNVANLTRIGTGLDTFMAANNDELNRLDSLLSVAEVAGTAGAFDVTTFPAVLGADTNGVELVTLNDALVVGTTAYGGFPGLLARYYLTDSDVQALNRIGLKYVMTATDGGRFSAGDDGAWPQGSINDRDTIFCLAKSLTNGFPLAVINPAGVIGAGQNIKPIGARVYESCGQEVFFTTTAQLLIGETQVAPADGLTTLATNDGQGILLAFGVGQFASIIGNNRAGLDNAPVCPIVSDSTEYRRYIMLIRLRHTSAGSEAEYAGIIDPTGQTILDARAALN